MNKMISLIKAEYKYNMAALAMVALAFTAVFSTLKAFNHLEPMMDTGLIANFFLVIVIGNTIKIITEKRARMHIPLTVTAVEIAISRLLFFVTFQTSLTFILVLVNWSLQLDLSFVNPSSLIFINIQFLIMSTFIMLHNSLGFYNRFIYRFFLYGIPLVLIIIFIIFFEMIRGFIEEIPMPEYTLTALAFGVWLTMAFIYIISFAKGPAYTE